MASRGLVRQIVQFPDAIACGWGWVCWPTLCSELFLSGIWGLPLKSKGVILFAAYALGRKPFELSWDCLLTIVNSGVLQLPYLLVYRSTFYDQKISPKNHPSHTQRPDQAVQEISITTAWSALGKPLIIVVDFRQFSAHSSSTKKVWNNKC